MNLLRKLKTLAGDTMLFTTQLLDAVTEAGIRDRASATVEGSRVVEAAAEELKFPAAVSDASQIKDGPMDVPLTNRQQRLLLSSGIYRVNVISYREKKDLKHIGGPRMVTVRRFTPLKVGDRPDGYLVSPFVVASSLLERYKDTTGSDYALEDVRTTQLVFSTEKSKTKKGSK